MILKRKNLLTLIIICVILIFCLSVIVDYNINKNTKLLKKTSLTYGRELLYRYTDGCLYYIHDNELWLMSMEECSESTCVVPNEIDGYKVTGFVESAIKNCNGVKTLILSDNIEFVDFDLYYEFSSLESIYIGSGVQRIMDGIFFNCPNLKQVIVSIQNPYFYSEGNCILTKNENMLIASSSAMTEIPESAKIIGGNSFLNLSIKTVVIPDNVVEIRDVAFQGCNELSSIYIPNTVETISDRLFLNIRGDTNKPIAVFCEASSKPDGWADNWYYVDSKGWNDEHDDDYYKELNDSLVTIHWGSTIDDYNEFVKSKQN